MPVKHNTPLHKFHSLRKTKNVLHDSVDKDVADKIIRSHTFKDIAALIGCLTSSISGERVNKLLFTHDIIALMLFYHMDKTLGYINRYVFNKHTFPYPYVYHTIMRLRQEGLITTFYNTEKRLAYRQKGNMGVEITPDGRAMAEKILENTKQIYISLINELTIKTGEL
jgi:DNA-binding PadR family transcriptional regulator